MIATTHRGSTMVADDAESGNAMKYRARTAKQLCIQEEWDPMHLATVDENSPLH